MKTQHNEIGRRSSQYIRLPSPVYQEDRRKTAQATDGGDDYVAVLLYAIELPPAEATSGCREIAVQSRPRMAFPHILRYGCE
jgi:hypothetical protein